MTSSTRILAAATLGAALSLPAFAQTVKVTPLGGFDGEFCAQDRALVFEDPNGTRILYDAGFTVRGAEDPRLGKIDAVLLSHAHGFGRASVAADDALLEHHREIAGFHLGDFGEQRWLRGSPWSHRQ